MKTLKNLVNFFDSPFVVIIGGLATIMSILLVISKFIEWLWGITPLAWRIGSSLSNRKICIVGDTDSTATIKQILVDSGLFKTKNISAIHANNIDIIKSFTVIVFDWETAGSEIENVFHYRRSSHTPVVILAKPGSIESSKMFDIANRVNTCVVNFKGRLINDIVTSLITTKNEKI